MNNTKSQPICARGSYLRISPQKAREVARWMKGRPAIEALEYLTLLPQKAAKLIYAVLKSAVANAEHNAKLPKEALHVENVIIQQGPVIKRYMPRARGSASPIRKPMSHIFVTLSSNN